MKSLSGILFPSAVSASSAVKYSLEPCPNSSSKKPASSFPRKNMSCPFPRRPETSGEFCRSPWPFPNRYYTAMSNLGFQAVYWLFNQQPETVCQRVFLPDPEDLPEYRRTETPLFSLESRWPVRSFDVLAFSVSYENDFPHLLTMLDLAGIPLLKKDRTERDPWVMAGGASILMNPEPLADFVDFFVIGEAEEVVRRLTEILRSGREAESPRGSGPL